MSDTTTSSFPRTVTIRLPSVLTRSASSTPASWLFVPVPSVPAPESVALGLDAVVAGALSTAFDWLDPDPDVASVVAMSSRADADTGMSPP